MELKKSGSANLDEFVKSLISDEDQIKKKLKACREIAKLEELFKNSKLSRKPNSHFARTGVAIAQKHDELSRVKDEISKIQIEKAKVDTQTRFYLRRLKGFWARLIERLSGRKDGRRDAGFGE